MAQVTGSFSTSNGNTTHVTEITASNSGMRNKVTDALKERYKSGFPFPENQPTEEESENGAPAVYTKVDDMTNQQKATALAYAFFDYGLSMAETAQYREAQEETSQTTETELETRYE